MCEAEGYSREITPLACEYEFIQRMSEAIVIRGEVIFVPCPEFRNSMESGKLETASKPCLKRLEKQIHKFLFSPFAVEYL